jgi:4-carboxymuconolactone decarboxylase
VDLIEALIARRPPKLQDELDASAYEVTRQLADEHRIDPETYARAVEVFGPKGVVDIVLLVGLYLTTCAIINAFDVAAPEPTR